MKVKGRATQAGAWWIAAPVALMAAVGWFGTSDLGGFDRAGLTLANAWRSPWLDTVFANLTWLGSLTVLLPLVLAAGILLWRRGRHDEARFLMAALVGASLLAHATKHMVLRPRPELFAALTPVTSPLSFPSAHAAQVTALAAAVWVLVSRLAPSHRRWVLPVLISIVGLVNFSRVYLQVHYPSDVLVGTVAAACWVFALGDLMFVRAATRSI